MNHGAYRPHDRIGWPTYPPEQPAAKEMAGGGAIIRREVFAGTTEGQALPSGEYVIGLREAAVLTDRGRIEAPSPIRFPVQTVGTGRGRCIAGQSQDSGATWEWVENDGRWWDRGGNAGERPVCYMPDGTLVIERGGPDHPTEGWAGTGLDGFPVRIVRFDPLRDIHETTEIGPFLIGQSSIDGIELQFDGVRYQVEPGDVHTIWAVLGANGVLSIATRKLAQNETVCLWVDVNKITELPLAPTKVPPVIVVPPIIVPPKEPTVEVPNLFAIIERVAATVPLTAGQESCGRFTEACAVACHAADPRFGHLKKNPGQTQFNGHAVDALLFKDTGQAVDIIVGSKTDNPKPGWGVDIPRYSASDWIQPAGGDVPPVVVPPKPDTALVDRVAALEAKFAGILSELKDAAEINGLQAGTLDQHGLAIAELKARPTGGGAVDLSGYARKGDRVTVTGRIPILGNVTVHGTIDQ